MGAGRPIDHIVLPCRDLGGAARSFERLGFQVGRRNRHPWGTENHIVQYPGAFLELIAFAQDFQPPSPDDDAFSFAGFLATKAASDSPNAMVVLRSGDAHADAEAFARSGIGSRRTLEFSRDTTSATGEVKTVAFGLAFAEAPLMPDIGFFVCQHHRPENFWNAAAQRHPNGVRTLTGLVIVADRPGDHVDFLHAFASVRPDTVRHDLLAFRTGDSVLEVMTVEGFRSRFGNERLLWTDRVGRSPVLAAIRFGTAEAPGTGQIMRAAGGQAAATGNGWTAAFDRSSGPLLVFEEA